MAFTADIPDRATDADTAGRAPRLPTRQEVFRALSHILYGPILWALRGGALTTDELMLRVTFGKQPELFRQHMDQLASAGLVDHDEDRDRWSAVITVAEVPDPDHDAWHVLLRGPKGSRWPQGDGWTE